MKQKHLLAFLKTAYLWSQLSPAVRRKVGCVIVSPGGVIAASYNGTPPGFDNRCEDDYDTTLPTVIHAEANSLDKFLRSGVTTAGAVVICTDSPCLLCAVRLANAGIAEFHYHREYRCMDGLDHLSKCGIIIGKIEYDNPPCA